MHHVEQTFSMGRELDRLTISPPLMHTCTRELQMEWVKENLYQKRLSVFHRPLGHGCHTQIPAYWLRFLSSRLYLEGQGNKLNRGSKYKAALFLPTREGRGRKFRTGNKKRGDWA